MTILTSRGAVPAIADDSAIQNFVSGVRPNYGISAIPEISKQVATPITSPGSGAGINTQSPVITGGSSSSLNNAILGGLAGAGAGSLINSVLGGSGSGTSGGSSSNPLANAAKQVLSNAVKQQVSKNPSVVKATIDALKNAGATSTSTAPTSQVQFKENADGTTTVVYPDGTVIVYDTATGEVISGGVAPTVTDLTGYGSVDTTTFNPITQQNEQTPSPFNPDSTAPTEEYFVDTFGNYYDSNGDLIYAAQQPNWNNTNGTQTEPSGGGWDPNANDATSSDQQYEDAYGNIYDSAGNLITVVDNGSGSGTSYYDPSYDDSTSYYTPTDTTWYPSDLLGTPSSTTDTSYYTPIDTSFGPKWKKGGLATPLFKKGGKVKHFDDGGYAGIDLTGYTSTPTAMDNLLGVNYLPAYTTTDGAITPVAYSGSTGAPGIDLSTVDTSAVTGPDVVGSSLDLTGVANSLLNAALGSSGSSSSSGSSNTSGSSSDTGLLNTVLGFFQQNPGLGGGLIGALLGGVLSDSDGSNAAVNKGVDMSKVGVIPSRTTSFGVGPTRFVGYNQYGAQDLIPVANAGELYRNLNVPGFNPVGSGLSSLSYAPNRQPMSSPVVDFNRPAPPVPPELSSTIHTANPLAGTTAHSIDPSLQSSGSTITNPYAPFSAVTKVQYKKGGLASPAVNTHYTFGTPVDVEQNLMADGGTPTHMNYNIPSLDNEIANVPKIGGRNDYRQGSYVEGPGDGQSDDIPAMLADGEYVIDAETVAQLGNGSNKAGAKVLDTFRKNIRAHKRSAPHDKIPPKAKSPLAYLKGAK